MIRLNDLTIGYGHRILLQHASATIPAGELVALVGRNGTGKSTLLRAIAGFGERLGAKSGSTDTLWKRSHPSNWPPPSASSPRNGSAFPTCGAKMS